MAEIENVNLIVQMFSKISQINRTWNVWLERQFHETLKKEGLQFSQYLYLFNICIFLLIM